ncbi:hypothetical protein MBBAR_26c00010 [Methanobrevibacter arboriphilus JCM 13429 = DSM 1125]|uniref:Uncharacterized protein n=1 Tax=Methanobrevibacter arboriphilus JCM 13429 = DSM 1125 TaxID=1300164 RepID=A0A1V6N0M8_METAZ|nr:hypothetical protein [Methanobrevibacter arboriphilus]OQD58172.1 hypothetical protein MBBAR_26c00010 [Methanobrevibacter arboriphilus JCM 13429 = DSM 1125]
MDKLFILFIILIILGIVVGVSNQNIVDDSLNNIKTILEGEANQEPIANLSTNYNNTTNSYNNSTNKTNSNSKINSNNITDNNSNNSNFNEKSDLINSNNPVKTYNNNGISFSYPSYWSFDQLNKFLSLYQKEYLSRWDDGLIFYISDNSLEEELELQKSKRFKQPTNITVDGKKAYSLTSTKADYWHQLIIVQKNKTHSYVFIFYCDRELKKQDKILFNEILKTMKLE